MYQTSSIISIFIDNFLCVEFFESGVEFFEEGSKLADMINGETGEVDDILVFIAIWTNSHQH